MTAGDLSPNGDRVAFVVEVTMAKRVCTEPGCPELTDAGTSRCPDHRSQRERTRGTRQQRGYDSDHDQLRARWQGRLEAGDIIRCWRCANTIDPDNWHLGHDDNDRTKYRGPECVPCNTATSGRRNIS